MRPLIFIGLLFFTFQCNAQVALTLQECINLAYQNNLDLKSSQLNVAFSEIDLQSSKMARLPNLNGQIGASYFAGRGIDPTTNDFITETFLSNDMALNSSVTLFSGGRIHHQIHQDRLELAASQELFEQAMDDVGLQVVLSFLNVLLGQETVENARSQMEITSGQLADLEKLIDAGVRAQNDRLDLDAQLSLGEQNLIIAQNQLTMDLLTLKQAIRWESDENITVVVPDLSAFDVPSVETFDLEELHNIAMQSQHVVEASEINLEQSTIGLKVAKSSIYPTLTASFGLNTRYSDAARAFDSEFQWIPIPTRIDGQSADLEILQAVSTNPRSVSLSDQWNQNFGYGGGITLSVPIFNRGSTHNNIQRSKLAISQAEIDLERTKDQLKRDVENAYVTAQNSEKTFFATQKSLKATEAVLENTTKRYNVGSATNLELTTARINFENAQRDHTTARYNYIFSVKVLDYYLGKELKF